ncbi:hypothetical protein H2198_007470 [Neophaeococcomyces mojaviensis]|uniref:Uncharacterized protein n=1 Tax=Neophaeococcomyces mojaviensis TaxID=3383035 RepID=A0ACC2ZZT6_9EURO|nr:hypothetical protein H2198_007470 [Knufia sp. JES_112]
MHSSFIGLLAILHTAVAAPHWGDWQASSLSSSTSLSTGNPTRSSQTTTWSKTTSTPVTKTTTIQSHWEEWGNKTTTTTTKTRTRPATSTFYAGWNNWSPSGGSGDSRNPNSNQNSNSPSDHEFYSSNVVNNDGWDRWYDQPPLYSQAAPTATLVATTHWNLDKSDTANVVAGNQNSIYYATNGDSSPSIMHQMAWVHANFTSDAVLLDHSDLLTYNYVPASQALTVTFQDKTAFVTAQTSWKQGVIMVTNDGKCGADESCYLKVTKLSFDENSLVCTMSISSIEFQQAVSYFDYEWGVYRPGTNTNSTSHSTSTSLTGSQQTTTQGPQSGYPITTTSGSFLTTTTTSGSYTSSSPTGSSNSSHAGVYEVDNVDELNCTAPADGKTGLPAACLGADFDEDIDEKYGYQSLKESEFGTFASQFNDLFSSDGGDSDAEDEKMYADDEAALGLNEDMDLDFSKRHVKRVIGRLIPKKLRRAIAKVLPIKGVTTPLRIEKSLAKMNMVVPKKRKTQKSPWGQQLLIGSFTKKSKTNAENQGKVEVFCVDCGMQGRVEIFGKAGVSVLDGLESLGARLELDMALTLKVGIDAKIVYSHTFQQNLFSVPLSKTCVKPIICAGPVLKLGADLELSARGQGQLLAGATVAINRAKASVDLIPPKAAGSGWTPEFRPVFEAQGEVDLTADFGLPLALALELNVLNGKFKRDIALVNRPALVANAAVAVAASLEDGKVAGGVQSTNGCDGISTTLNLKNDIYVKLPNDKRINIIQIPPKQLASHCIGKKTSDSATTATPSDKTAANPEATDTPSESELVTRRTVKGARSRINAREEGDDAKSDPETPSVTPSDPDAPSVTTSDPNTSPSATASISTADTDPATTTTAGTNPTTVATQDDGDVQDTTADDRAGATEVTSDFVTPKHGDQTYKLTNGYSIVTLADSLGNYQLHTCADGNFHLFNIDESIPDFECGSGFTMVTTDGIIMADAMARIPIYYPDEMEKLGLSRFRVVDDRSIPKGAKEIVLIPDETEMESGEKAVLYYPMTPDSADGTTFYPFVCKYADEQPDKIFLAADAETALTSLLNPELESILMGGKVTECWNMPIVKSNGKKAAGEGDWLSDDNQVPTTTAASVDPATTTTT